MYRLTKKLEGLEPYEPISGDYKIRLDANESFIRITDAEIAEAVKGLELNRYPDPYALTALKAFGSRYGVNPDYLTAGNGSDELISVITACFLEKGDTVCCFANDFSMYGFYSYLYELNVVTIEKNADLTINVEKTIETINSLDAKAIIFSNPCNPTSLGLSRADVIKLIESVKALVVLDEAYMEFWGQENSLLDKIEVYDNLLILKTCSKALAMAGLRLGFAAAGKRITNALRAAKSPYNVNSVTQAVGSYVLSDKRLGEERVETVVKSARALYQGIVSLQKPEFITVYPSVTNFVLIRTDKAREIYEYLLGRSIAVRFIGKYIRICCGTAEENQTVIAALKDFVG